MSYIVFDIAKLDPLNGAILASFLLDVEIKENKPKDGSPEIPKLTSFDLDN